MAMMTITTDGIKVKVNEKIMEDFRTKALLTKLNKPSPPESEEEAFIKDSNEKGNLTLKYMELILGEDQLDKVVESLAAKNDGIATLDDVFEWFKKVQKKIPNQKK